MALPKSPTNTPEEQIAEAFDLVKENSSLKSNDDWQEHMMRVGFACGVAGTLYRNSLLDKTAYEKYRDTLTALLYSQMEKAIKEDGGCYR